MLSFYSARNLAHSNPLARLAPMADRSAHPFRAALRKGVLLPLFILLAACGGGGSGGEEPGESPVVLLWMTLNTPLNLAHTVLELGATVTLGATGTYSDATKRDLSGSAIWTSSAPHVATITPGGVVSAVAGGTTTITATSDGISASTPFTVQSAVVTYLHVFGAVPSDGSQPNGPLLQASDGNFYGTTRAGGANRCSAIDNFCGAIFRLTPDGTVTVLYSFGASPTDGWAPYGPLIQARDGALYGVTFSGGTYDVGTVFKITLDGAYTVLHSFGASLSEGQNPFGALLEASDGNFYGATLHGGEHCARVAFTCGTIFRISPNGEHAVLYSFGSSPEDGAVPNGHLIEGSDGSFYGTTSLGGNASCTAYPEEPGCGTVFKMTLAGEMTLLHSFGASNTDGAFPLGPLVLGDDGIFYGTTYYGGDWYGCSITSPGCGTVFQITPAGALTILYSFTPPGSFEGRNPTPFLIRGRDGNFYGMTESAQSGYTGTVFRLTPSGLKQTLYTFGPAEFHPLGGLIEGTDGAFYGVTAYDGRVSPVALGTVFRLVVP
jgi:uncharacterized repeat protein (TIGR03803 family)